LPFRGGLSAGISEPTKLAYIFDSEIIEAALPQAADTRG
jgi:hypothetical protein